MITQGGDVTIEDVSSITLGNATVGGLYDVTVDNGIDITGAISAASIDFDASTGIGNLTETGGVLTVSGTSTLAVQGTDVITLASASNDVNTVLVTAGSGTVTLVDVDDIALGVSTMTGLLDVTADAIDVTGTVTAGSLDFDASGGVGDIIDSTGNLVVSGTSTLRGQTTDAITLDALTNNFASLGVTQGGNVTVTDVNGIVLNGIAASGNLNVTANGTITGSSVITVVGTTTLNATGTVVGTNDISLTNAANDFDTDNSGDALTVTNAGNVTLVDVNALTLGGLNLPVGALDIDATGITLTGTVTAASADLNASTGAGAINQTGGTVTVTGATVIAAQTTDNITLGQANDFDSDNSGSTVTVTSGNNVLLNDIDNITLGAVAASGTLNVTASGFITGSSVVTATGLTTLNAGGTSTTTNDITLNNTSNNFSTLVITNGGDVTIQDVSSINLGAATVGGLYDVTVGNGIDVTGAITAASIDFDASTGIGNITDTGGSLVVSGTATLAVQGTDVITLDTATNDFTTMLVTANSGTVTLVDVDDITFDTSSMNGLLSVTADGVDVIGTVTAGSLTIDASGGAGNVTDSAGNLVIAGTTTITAQTTDDVVLDAAANNFADIGVTQAANVTLNDTNSIVLNATGAGGNLGVTANGSITGTATVTVGGTTTLNATGTVVGTNDISLTNAANDFDTDNSGDALTVTNAGNVTLVDVNALTLGGLNLPVGALDIDATGITLTGTVTAASADLNASTGAGAINQTGGTVTVTGATVIAAQTTDNITLGQANDFDSDNSGSTVTVTSGNNVLLNDVDNITLGAVAASGTLNVTASGFITGSSVVTVGGTTTLNATGTVVGTNDITLNNAANDFDTDNSGDALTVTNAGNVTLVDVNALTLGGLNLPVGALDIDATGITLTGTVTAASADLNASTGAGAINQTGGTVTVTGATVIAAQTTDNITLGQANDFDSDNSGSTVTVTSGNNVLLNDIDNITLGAVAASGTLNVTASGFITGSSVVTVGGTTTLNATGTVVGTNDITLNNAANDFSTLIITKGGNVTIEDASNINLGAATIGGLYDVTVDNGIDVTGAIVAANIDFDASTGIGNITDTGGSLVVSGTATLAVQGTDVITLDTASNNFNTVVLTAGSGTVLLVDTNAIALGTSTMTGLLDVTANAIDVSGTVNAGSLILNASGAAGAVTDSTGNLIISGTTTITAQSTDNVTLDAAGNNFSDVGVQAGSVTLNDLNGIVLNSITANGNLAVTANGSISGSALIQVRGSTNLNATGTAAVTNAITLNNALNDFDNDDTGDALTVTNAGNVTLVDVDALTLGGLNLPVGALDIDATGITLTGTVTAASADLNASTGAGAINQTGGTVTVTGATVIAAQTTDNITLGQANDFDSDNSGSTVTVTSGNSVLLNDIDNITLGAVAASGTLNVTASGFITGSSVVTAAGITTLNAGGTTTGNNDITLNNTANDFSTLIVTNGGNVTIEDVSGINLGAANIGGLYDVTVDNGITVTGSIKAASVDFDAATGAGDIIDTGGDLTVSGVSTFTARVSDNVILDALTNDFGSLGVTQAANVTIRDKNSIVINTLAASGNLVLTTNGGITGTLPVTVTGTTTFDTTGTTIGANNISLTSATNDFNTVTVTRGGNVTLTDQDDITFTTSAVTGLFDVDAGEININAGQFVTAGSLDFATSGTGSINLGENLVTNTSGMTFSSAALLNIDANLTSAAGITAANITNISIEAGLFTANGSINFYSGGTVGGITIEGNGLVDFDANADGDISLANVTDIGDGLTTSLRLVAEGKVLVNAINLDDGTTDGVLSVHFDNDDDGNVSFTSNGNISNIAGITIRGSSNTSDTIIVNGDLATSSGDIRMSLVSSVDLNAGLNAAGALVIENVGTLNMAAGHSYSSNNGLVDFNNNVSAIKVDGSGTVTISALGGNNIELVGITDAGDLSQTDLQLTTTGDIALLAVDLSDGLTNGNFTITDANNVTLASGADVTAASITATKAGGVDKITLVGGVNTFTGGAINLTDVTSAATLQLDGTTINISSYLGTGNLDIVDSTNTTFAGTVNAVTVNVTNTNNFVNFEGNTTIGSLTTQSSGYGLSFTGGLTTFNNPVGFANSGGLVFGDNSADIILFQSGATMTSSQVTLAGSLRTTGDILTATDIKLAADSVIDTTNNGTNSAGAALNFSGLIDSTSATSHALTINSGSTGLITVAGAVDHINNFTIANSAGATFNNTIGSSARGSLAINATTTGSTINFQAQTLLTSLTTSAQGYKISFVGTGNEIANAVTFTNTGGVSLGNSIASSILFDGGVTSTASQMILAGTVTTTDDSLRFGNVSLVDTVTIDTTNGLAGTGGNLTLGAVTGDTISPFNLNAGTNGVLTVNGSVNSVPNLTIVNSGGASFLQDVGAINPGIVTITDTTDGKSIAFGGSTRITTLNTTAEKYNLSFTGTTNQIDNAVTFLNSTGTLTFGDSALDTITFVGGVNVGAAETFVAGSVTTLGTALNLDTLNVIQGATATLKTSGGQVTVNNVKGVAGGSGESLIIDAGTSAVKGTVTVNAVTGVAAALTNLTVTRASDVTFGGAVNLPGALVVSDTTGTTRFANLVSVGTSNIASGLTEITSGFTASGGFTSTGPLSLGANLTTAGSNISVTGNITIGDGKDVVITTGGGNLVVNGSLQGGVASPSESLTVNAGIGQVTITDLRGAAGSNGGANGLTSVNIANSSRITLNDVTLFGTLTTNSTGDVAITSSSIGQQLQLSGTVDGKLTVAAKGNIVGSGVLTVAQESSFTATDSAINLSNLTATGTVSLIGASAVVVNSKTLNLGTVTIGDVLNPVSANDASLTATTGLITGGAVIQVADLLTLVADSATGGVTLTNANNTFGSLNILSSQGTVRIRESDQTDIDFVNAKELILTSEGNINANKPGNIIGKLSIVEADAVDIVNTTAIVLDTVKAVDLKLTSGAITDTSASTNNQVAVSGVSTFTTNSADITLGRANLGTLNLVNAGNVKITEQDDIKLDAITATSLTIIALGDITQAAGSTVTINGLFSLDGDDIVLDGNNTFGSVELKGSNVEIDSSGDIELETITATTLTVTTPSGNITQQAGTNIKVNGLATFETLSGDITLTDPNSTFGSVSLTGSNVKFSASSQLRIEGIDADTLDLTAGGSIFGAGQVTVNGIGKFNAGSGTLDLTNANNIINTLSAVASAVKLSLAGDVQLDQITVANTINLKVAGAITDSLGSSIAVGQAILDATGDIVLGDTGSVNLGVLDLSGANIDVAIQGSAIIQSISAGQFKLSAAGAITQSDGSDINVTNAIFSNGGNNITLTGNNNSIRSLQVSAAKDIELTTTGALRLNTLTAENFTLNVGGEVSDGGRVNIAGAFIVDAGTSNILLNQNNHSFGTIATIANIVRIKESGASVLGDINVATFELTSSSDVTSQGVLRVSDSLVVTANDGLGQVTLTNAANRLNRVSVTAGDATLLNTQSTALVKVNAGSLTLTSGGNVTDSPDDRIEVRNLAKITAVSDITLGTNVNDTVNLGSVDLTGRRIQLTQQNDVSIANISASETLRVTSQEGGISSSSGAVITAGTDTAFTVTRDTSSIDLLGSTNKFGTLSLTGRNVKVSETDDINLFLLDSDNATLVSGGSITNSDRANINAIILADLTAAGDVVLGNGIVTTANFGRLNVNASNANIIESSATQIAGLNISGNLTLSSQNSMTDDDNATLFVGGLATLSVAGQPQQILFDGLNNSFGSMNLTSDNISITLASSTRLTNVVSNTLVMNAPAGIITVGSGANFLINKSADLKARRIVFSENSVNEVGNLSLSTRAGGAVEIRSNINPRLDASGKSTNPTGKVKITSPDIFIGVAGGTVGIKTVGGVDGGSVTISGVDATGQANAATGKLHLAGTVTVDTTNGGTSAGADVSIESDTKGSGLVRRQDGATNGALSVTAGAGIADIGNLDALSRLNSLTIRSASGILLDNVYTGGNTVDLTASGSVTVNGTLDDSVGSVNVLAGGSILVDKATKAGGSVSFSSTTGSINAQEITAATNVSASAKGSILLGSNTTAGSGTVTLFSAANVESVGTITSAGKTSVVGGGSVKLGSGGGKSVVAGGDAILTSGTGSLTVTDVTTAGEAILFSVNGKVSQAKNTVIAAGKNVTISADGGIDIASIRANESVTLVISKSNLAPGEKTPNFTRVNDPIPIGQGGTTQDINSVNGAIVFLAPLANVGSADVGQNFVQRAGTGIFYGLNKGSFFSDDIGSTAILNSIPTGTLDNLVASTSRANAIDVGSSISILNPVTINIDDFSSSLTTSVNASASAGQTSAASSSRSTAASQRDDDEEVDEVDEVAFQNLKNYDENTNGIRLPEDQVFAYDEEGNIYFIVTLAGKTRPVSTEKVTLYQVRLGLESKQLTATAQYQNYTATVDNQPVYGYKPEFMKLSMAGGDE